MSGMTEWENVGNDGKKENPSYAVILDVLSLPQPAVSWGGSILERSTK